MQSRLVKIGDYYSAIEQEIAVLQELLDKHIPAKHEDCSIATDILKWAQTRSHMGGLAIEFGVTAHNPLKLPYQSLDINESK